MRDGDRKMMIKEAKKELSDLSEDISVSNNLLEKFLNPGGCPLIPS